MTLALPKHDSGRKQRQNSQRGRRRRPNLSTYYGQKLSAVEPGDFTFRTVLVRPELGKRADAELLLDRATTYISWDDSAPVLSGSLTLLRSNPLVARSVPVQVGNMVRLMVRWHSKWHRLWQMRVNVEPSVNLKAGELSVGLTDDLEALQRDEQEWEFKKDGQHPQGWLMHEVIIYVAKRCGVKLGQIARGEKPLDSIKFRGSGLEAIRRATKAEGEDTYRVYVIRFRQARLTVLPVQRHEIAYQVSRGLIDGTLEARTKTERPPTVVRATGQVDGDKLTVRIGHPEIIRRLGRSTLEKDFGKLDSAEDLKDKARRELARQLRITRTADLTIPGNPFIGRGDAIHWLNHEPGWHGASKHSRDRQWCFASAVSHTVSPGDFTTVLSLRQRDPFLADRQRRDQARRDARHKERQGRNQDGKKGADAS